jgi:hypothetical protein
MQNKGISIYIFMNIWLRRRSISEILYKNRVIVLFFSYSNIDLVFFQRKENDIADTHGY